MEGNRAPTRQTSDLAPIKSNIQSAATQIALQNSPFLIKTLSNGRIRVAPTKLSNITPTPTPTTTATQLPIQPLTQPSRPHIGIRTSTSKLNNEGDEVTINVEAQVSNVKVHF
jgi:hypothetical protein